MIGVASLLVCVGGGVAASNYCCCCCSHFLLFSNTNNNNKKMASESDKEIPNVVIRLWELQAEVSECERSLDFVCTVLAKFTDELNRVQGLIDRKEAAQSNVGYNLMDTLKDLKRYITHLEVDYRGWLVRIYDKKLEKRAAKKEVADMGLADFDLHSDSDNEDDSGYNNDQHNYAVVEQVLFVPLDHDDNEAQFADLENQKSHDTGGNNEQDESFDNVPLPDAAAVVPCDNENDVLNALDIHHLMLDDDVESD